MSDIEIISDFRGKYAALSNFFYVPITYDGIEYPSVEHAFQAAKTLDQAVRLQVAQAASAGAAKRIGRKITDQRELWAELVRFQVMDELLALKFSPDNADPLDILLSTGTAVLIEGNNWHDNTWGSCTCDKCGRHGSNALGRSLMKLRDTYVNAVRVEI